MTSGQTKLFLCTLAGLALTGCVEPAVEPVPGLKAFAGARIIDGNGTTIENGILVVRDGRVEAIRNRQSLLPAFIVELHRDEFRRESGSHELVKNGPGPPNMA